MEPIRAALPQLVQKHIFLSIDEYAYFGGSFNRAPDVKMALAYGMILNEMLRHTDFLRMSARTMGVSTLDYMPTAAVLNTTGLVYKLYGDSFVPGSIPVALTATHRSPRRSIRWAATSRRLTPAARPYPLDMFAALSPDRKYSDGGGGECDGEGTEFRSECGRSAAEGPADVMAGHGQRFAGGGRGGARAAGQDYKNDIERSGAKAVGRAHQRRYLPVCGGTVTRAKSHRRSSKTRIGRKGEQAENSGSNGRFDILACWRHSPAIAQVRRKCLRWCRGRSQQRWSTSKSTRHRSPEIWRAKRWIGRVRLPAAELFHG